MKEVGEGSESEGEGVSERGRDRTYSATKSVSSVIFIHIFFSEAKVGECNMSMRGDKNVLRL